MRRRADGFTLIEMLIALALFALISLAGFGLIESILGAQSRTQGRLERLGDIQRAMFLVTRDFEQTADAPLVAGNGGVAFTRHGATGGDIAVGYSLRGGALERTLGSGAQQRTQRLLDRVGGLRWQFYRAVPAGWLAGWPPADLPPNARPRAVALDLVLQPVAGLPGGTVRRVTALPVQP